MNGSWAILNNDMVVVALWEGAPWDFDWQTVENYGGEVKYSEPYAYRGTPTIGSVWSNDLDRFVD